MGSFTGKKTKSKASAFARAAAKSEPAAPKGDEFDPGSYLVSIKDVQESDNGSFGITFEGRGKDTKLGERIQWFSTAGKAAHVSGPRIKSLCMAMLGFDREQVDEYNDLDPNGEFLDAVLKYDLEAAAALLVSAGHAKSAKAALASLVGAEFVIKVTKGGEKDDGGFFRNATFDVAGDTEDDTDADEAPESEPAPRRAKKKTRR